MYLCNMFHLLIDFVMKKISIKDLKFEKRILAQLSESELSSLKGGAGTEDTLDSLCECATDICLTDTEVETSGNCAPRTIGCTPPIGTLSGCIPIATNSCTVSCDSYACNVTMFVQCSE